MSTTLPGLLGTRPKTRSFYTSSWGNAVYTGARPPPGRVGLTMQDTSGRSQCHRVVFELVNRDLSEILVLVGGAILSAVPTSTRISARVRGRYSLTQTLSS